ncbi:MAG: TonB-dependent receptor plug domain-containing protein, partial [Janthinobacterium lividum]
MRIKAAILASTAAIAIVSSASAQQSPAGQGPGGEPSSTTTAPTATPADQSDIVVTGIRASLGSAERIKRDAPQIIDSVVAEDIGKLPDISVADTAARIAGVQVYRQAGEAGSVLVRGLPYFETTYDGREIFTAETRVVALQDFPSQNVAALQVIKTSTADLVESGLAGSVNVVSRKPFDFKDSWTASAAGQANYTRNADAFRPQGNVLISHRWDSNIGEMGVLVNGSYTELRYLDNELSNTDFVANPSVNGQVVRLPDVLRLYDRSGDRARPSVNAAFQWKPNPSLEIYAGALWQGFRNRIDDRQVEADLYNAVSY